MHAAKSSMLIAKPSRKIGSSWPSDAASQVGVNDGNVKAYREVCLPGVELLQRSPHCVNFSDQLVGPFKHWPRIVSF
jgi:hypothetical protein